MTDTEKTKIVQELIAMAQLIEGPWIGPKQIAEMVAWSRAYDDLVKEIDDDDLVKVIFETICASIVDFSNPDWKEQVVVDQEGRIVEIFPNYVEPIKVAGSVLTKLRDAGALK